MDLRERVLELMGTEAFEEILHAAIGQQLRNHWTAMPTSLTQDSDGKTVTAKSNIKAQQRDADGKETYVDLPLFTEAPINFTGGGGVTHTYPLKEKDEGLTIFASRAVAAWREEGGTQQPVDTRSHDLSDGFHLPGIRSKPRDLKDINTEAAENRSDDGKQRAIVHPKNGIKTTVNGGKQVLDVNAKTGQVEVKSKTVSIGAGDAMAGRGANVANTADRQLNEALKGLRADLTQVKDSHHALFDVVSKLRTNVERVVPTLAPVNLATQVTNALSGAPGGLDVMKGLAAGNLQAYFQNSAQDALQGFLNPSRLLGATSVLSGGIESLMAGLQAQIAKLIEMNPILAEVDDLQRQAEAILTRGAKPEVEAAQLKPVQDALAAIAKDNPAVGILQGLQDQLKALTTQAGPGLNFLEPQKQIAQGVIKSLHLSEGG